MKKLLLILVLVVMGIQGNAQSVAEYNFDNTYADTSGNVPFASGSGIGFVNDRNGRANSALSLVNVGTTAAIANLPIGNSERTISFWISCNNTLDDNNYFNYGTNLTNAAFGLGKFKTITWFGSYAQVNNKLSFFGFGNDLEINPYTTNPTTWTHFVVTYSNDDVASLYINGVLAATATKAGWNTTASAFRLGKSLTGVNSISAYYDDLKIYSRAISATEVSNLYYSNAINPSPSIPTTAIYESPNSETTRRINYSLIGNDLASTSVINYGTSAGSLTSQVIGGGASGYSATSTSGLLTGLVEGETYYYQIVATNSYGTTSSTVQSFVHVAPKAIAEYRFDNTYNNTSGSNPFTAVATTSFTADRFNNSAKAIYIDYTGTTATIPNLPYGKNARTISMWHKDDNIYNLDYNYSFHYGAIGNGYGFRFKPLESGVYGNTGTSAPLSIVNQNLTGTWYHFVCTYDGINSKIYRNGVLISTSAVSWETVNNSDVFSLGLDRINGYPNRFRGAIDDLKIYNYVLSDAEINNLYTANALVAPPIISNISSSSNVPPTADIYFNLQANDSNATYVINYGVAANALTNSTSQLNASGYVSTPMSASITGLTLGTTYFYNIVATNSFGTTTSNTLSFAYTEAIAEYNFNNTYNNILGNTPFSSNSGTSFVAGRNGTPSSALNMNNSGSFATIAGLPHGTSARTVSIWVKLNALNASGFNYIYLYGTAASYYGAYQGNANINHFGASNHPTASAAVANVWNHFVFTFDGNESKIYKNGTLLSAAVVNFNNAANNNLFRLGTTETGDASYFSGAIDDLKIYSRAISAAEVGNLYTGNSILSTQTFNTQNLKATIYPNPAANSFTVQTENELKSVAIFSLLGQKMLTSNSKTINVSSLAKGIYMVRIEDVNNAVSTQKLLVQ